MALHVFHVSTKIEVRMTFRSKVIAHFLSKHYVALWPCGLDSCANFMYGCTCSSVMAYFIKSVTFDLCYNFHHSRASYTSTKCEDRMVR